MPDKLVAIKTIPRPLVLGGSPTLDPNRPVADTKELRQAYIDAKWAIGQKYMEIGGATGLPVGPMEDAAGEGFPHLRRYQNGIIYWARPIGARWVHGAILAKYQELGGEGVLGFPTTDETATPDGVGRYNHFERGSIYWTPGTGAREVHGMIRDHWQLLGWERSWLGYPISDEMAFPEGGRVSVFQNGSIYWWPDTGARALNDVVVQYTGLFCFGVTDADLDSIDVPILPFDVPVPSGDDEPFAALGVKGPGVENTFQTQIYEVEPGDTRPDLIELYRGKPRGLLVNALLTEFSGGDTDLSRRKIKEAYEKASPYVVEAISEIPYVGPVLGPVAEVGLAAAKSAILDTLNSFVESTLGYANRPLGEDAITLSARDMILLATRPEGNAFLYGIAWKFETALLSRFSASYKLYFNILPA